MSIQKLTLLDLEWEVLELFDECIFCERPFLPLSSPIDTKSPGPEVLNRLLHYLRFHEADYYRCTRSNSESDTGHASVAAGPDGMASMELCTDSIFTGMFTVTSLIADTGVTDIVKAGGQEEDSSEVDKPYDLDDSEPREQSKLVPSSTSSSEPSPSPTSPPAPTVSSSHTSAPPVSPWSTSPSSQPVKQREIASKRKQFKQSVPAVIRFSLDKKSQDPGIGTKKSRKVSDTSQDQSILESSSPILVPKVKEGTEKPEKESTTAVQPAKGISFRIQGAKFGTASKQILGAWKEAESENPKTNSLSTPKTDWWSLSETGKAAALADAKAVKAVCRVLKDPVLASEERVTELLHFICPNAIKYCFNKTSQPVVLALLECLESRGDVEQFTEALNLRETSAVSMAKDPVASEILVALLHHACSRQKWVNKVGRWILDDHKAICETEHGPGVVAAAMGHVRFRNREGFLTDTFADFQGFKEAISSPGEAILVGLLVGGDWAAEEARDRLLVILKLEPQVFFTSGRTAVASTLLEKCGDEAAAAVKAAALRLKNTNNTALRFATTRFWDEMLWFKE